MDTGTIGDPLLDIGHLLARWTEPGEPVLDEQAEEPEGYPARRQLAAASRGAHRARPVGAPYFEALALFKLAVILEGTFTRQRNAGIPDDENMMVDTVPRLLRFAAEFARGERI
jgi:aminoglycoside phosphotransferase (APT) family kinase protein